VYVPRQRDLVVSSLLPEIGAQGSRDLLRPKYRVMEKDVGICMYVPFYMLEN
jgi:hypothetical protein